MKKLISTLLIAALTVTAPSLGFYQALANTFSAAQGASVGLGGSLAASGAHVQAISPIFSSIDLLSAEEKTNLTVDLNVFIHQLWNKDQNRADEALDPQLLANELIDGIFDPEASLSERSSKILLLEVINKPKLLAQIKSISQENSPNIEEELDHLVRDFKARPKEYRKLLKMLAPLRRTLLNNANPQTLKAELDQIFDWLFEPKEVLTKTEPVTRAGGVRSGKSQNKTPDSNPKEERFKNLEKLVKSQGEERVEAIKSAQRKILFSNSNTRELAIFTLFSLFSKGEAKNQVVTEIFTRLIEKAHLAQDGERIKLRLGPILTQGIFSKFARENSTYIEAQYKLLNKIAGTIPNTQGKIYNFFADRFSKPLSGVEMGQVLRALATYSSRNKKIRPEITHHLLKKLAQGEKNGDRLETTEGVAQALMQVTEGNSKKRRKIALKLYERVFISKKVSEVQKYEIANYLILFSAKEKNVPPEFLPVLFRVLEITPYPCEISKIFKAFANIAKHSRQYAVHAIYSLHLKLKEVSSDPFQFFELLMINAAKDFQELFKHRPDAWEPIFKLLKKELFKNGKNLSILHPIRERLKNDELLYPIIPDLIKELQQLLKKDPKKDPDSKKTTNSINAIGNFFYAAIDENPKWEELLVKHLLGQLHRATPDQLGSIAAVVGILRLHHPQPSGKLKPHPELRDALWKKLSKGFDSAKSPSLSLKKLPQSARWYQDGETVVKKKMPTLFKILKSPKKLARLLFILSALRLAYPYDLANASEQSPIEWAKSTGIEFQLNELHILPVTESFRRHILYIKDKEGIFAVELKIPGQISEKSLIEPSHFEVSSRLWDHYPENPGTPKPIYFGEFQGALSMYGKDIAYPKDREHLGVMIYHYEEGRRFKNLLDSGNLSRLAKKIGVPRMKLYEEILIASAVTAIRLHEWGYTGSDPKAGTEMHTENIKVLNNGQGLLAGDFGIFREVELGMWNRSNETLSLLGDTHRLRMKSIFPRVVEELTKDMKDPEKKKHLEDVARKELGLTQ